MGRQIIATVSQGALRHNLKTVQNFAPKSKVMAMVKANAYGHGIAHVAKAMQEADALGVACLEEALIIRQAGLNNEIVLIEGIFHYNELPLVQAHHITQVIHRWDQIWAIRDYTGECKQKFSIWLKVNTGMNRLGFQREEFSDAYNALSRDLRVEIKGYMTQFAKADDKNDEITLKQQTLFNQVIGERPGEKCLANSAGIIAWPQTHADWVRPGIMLYGASPFLDSPGKTINLKPAMSLKAEIIAVRDVAVGEKVGYFGAWECRTSPRKIAIVAIGYGDGYPRHANNGTPVLVNGKRAEVAGRVSMDMLAIDVTNVGKLNIGDPVILWGDDLPIEEVALATGTIPNELFCRFTNRVYLHLVP